MDERDVNDLMIDLERSIQLRQEIQEKLRRGEFVDLVNAWENVERIDHQVTRKIRKRRPE
jgi:hypothetical protein